MDVVEPMVWSAANQARFGTDLTHILRDRRLDELGAMTAEQTEQGLQVRCTVATGTLFLEVVRAVIKNRFDLVIKSAEPSRGHLHQVFGPNDQHLIRKCPCPVWIDRSDRPRPYRKILAAVDPIGDADSRLDRTILELALSFIPWEGSEVHVAHAWHLPGEAQLRGGQMSISQSQVDELLQDKERMHADALQSLLADYDVRLDAPNVHFRKSPPAPLIAELAESLPADLIVIGTVGRVDIPGFFIGNTAESVVQMTDVPVLTVKPRNFKTPITV